jgi:hypothetical protein
MGMMQFEMIRERYLRDGLQLRSGGLAANLARIVSCADQPNETGKYSEAVAHLLEESQWFIEWNGPDAPLETQAELAQLQIRLAVWHRVWTQRRMDASRRREMIAQARIWSDRVLELSGLLAKK